MAVPTQHPAVVLPSRFGHVRKHLAIAAIAVVGLTVALVIDASEDPTDDRAISTAAGGTDSARSEFRMPWHASEHGGAPVPDLRLVPRLDGRRFDGGPEEGSRGIVATQAPSTRSDGGPEEGSRGPRG